jgi:N-dimethylarginine dimethylaminohydrolase
MTEQEPAHELEAYMNLHRILRARPEPPFEDPKEQQRVWGQSWGLNNDVGQIRKILVCRPGPQWEDLASGGEYYPEADSTISQDRMWYWTGPKRPNLERAQAQHDTLVETLRTEGAEVIQLQNPNPRRYHAVFVRDNAIITKGGAIVCRMGPDYRRGEELPVMRTLAGLGMPILHTIHGTGLMEGGSFLWLTPRTAVVAAGYRSNQAAIAQLRAVLETQGVELLVIDNRGYGLHIDGDMVMVDVDKALLFFFEIPYWLIDRAEAEGIELIAADPRDGPFGVNCLAVRPGRIIISSHAVRTAERLAKAGVEAILIDYDEFPKMGGGIHCSTLPLVRDDIVR